MNRLGRTLRADLKNALNLKLALSVALVPLFILLDSAVDLEYAFSEGSDTSVYYFYFQSISFGGLYGRYLVGMLCALPYAAAFCDEYHAEMTPEIIARSGTNNYFLSKFIIGATSGGLVNMLGLLLMVLAMSVKLPLFHEADFQGMEDFFYMPIAMKNQAAYFAIAHFYAFLHGALLAGLAVWASGFIQNRYAILTVPPIAMFMQIQLSRIFGLPMQWQINQWLSMRVTIGNEQITILSALGVVVAILVLCACWFLRRGKKVIGCA